MKKNKFKVNCKKHNREETYTLGDLIMGRATTKNGEGGIFENWREYTGLKDKNGKEIYEGDIVKILGGEYEQGFYEWDETVQIKDFIYDGFNLMMTISQIGNQAIEVIGNIYDNPELLERSSNGKR